MIFKIKNFIVGLPEDLTHLRKDLINAPEYKSIQFYNLKDKKKKFSGKITFKSCGIKTYL